MIEVKFSQTNVVETMTQSKLASQPGAAGHTVTKDTTSVKISITI